MAKVLIEYEGNVDGLKATLSEVAAANEQISESAKKSSAEVAAEYKKVAAAGKAAFASEETKKALDSQVASVSALKTQLEKLYAEEVQLLSSGKQLTDQYKKNREEAARVRGEFDKLTSAENEQIKTEEKQVVVTKKLTTQLRDLKQQLSLLEDEGKATTKEFEQIAIAAAKLEDQIGDTQERVKSLASDTFVFDAAIDSVSALAGGFAVAEGAVGLFADGNEELQQAIAKTNSALAILNGLQQIQAFVTGQSAGKLALLNGAQKVYNFVVGQSTGALKGFRVALAATGVGLFVIALGYVVENFDKVKKAAFDVIPGLKEVSEFIGDVIDKTKELIGISDNSAAVKQVVDSIIGNEARRTNAQVKELDRRIELEKAFNKETKALEIEREQLQIESDKRRLELLKNNQAELVKLNADERKQIRDLADDLRQDILDRETKIAILRINKEKEITIAISDELQKRAEIRLKYDEITQARQLTEADFLTDIDERTNEQLLQERATFFKRLEAEGKGGLENRINIIKTESNAEIAAIREQLGFTLDANNKVAIIEAQTQEKIREERRRTFEESARVIFTYADAIASSLNSIADLQRQQTEERIAQIERIRDIEIKSNSDSQKSYAEKIRNEEAINLRANRKIVEEKRKQARLDKALGIFNATIDTAKAVVGFLSNPGGIPGIILSVAAGITGGVQIAKIASQPLPKYRKGGWINGASHEGGGVHIEAEGGEYVTRRGVASQHRTELEAMNKSKAAFMKVIEERYVRPRLMAAMMDKKDKSMNVNVNASLRSEKMESEIVALRRETRNTGKVISKALTSGLSSRYHWS